MNLLKFWILAAFVLALAHFETVISDLSKSKNDIEDCLRVANDNAQRGGWIGVLKMICAIKNSYLIIKNIMNRLEWRNLVQ